MTRQRRVGTTAQWLWIVMALVVLGVPLSAATAEPEPGGMPAFRSPALDVRPSPAPMESLDGPLRNAWDDFRARYAKDGRIVGFIDRRSGRPASVELSVPWAVRAAGAPVVAGSGNLIGGVAGAPDADLDQLAARALELVADNPALFRVAPDELVLDRRASGPSGTVTIAGKPYQRLWIVVFDWVPRGVPVEGARAEFRISAGNLVQFGLKNIGDASAVPSLAEQAKALTADGARRALVRSLGAGVGAEAARPEGQLRIVPVLPAEEAADRAPGPHPYRGPIGQGLRYRMAWTFEMGDRDGTLWRVEVNARTGELLSLRPAGADGHALGEVRFNDRTGASGAGTLTQVFMPYVDFTQSPLSYADEQGFYLGDDILSFLKGQLVSSTDGCGAISVTPSNGGDLAFGVTQNCAGDGNTVAAATAYYHVTKLKQHLRGILPTVGWLTSSTEVRTNDNEIGSCNGMYLDDPGSPGALAFGVAVPEYPVKPILCNNPGEVEGFVAHEVGHGVDFGIDGFEADAGSGEANGDITSFLRTRDSCIARGVGIYERAGETRTSSCGANNYTCALCDGLRTVDWHFHAPAVPLTPRNLTCGEPDLGRSGPCGGPPYCESAPASEAMWDLGEILQTDYGLSEAEAYGELEQLFYGGLRGASSVYVCDADLGQYGAGPGTLYETLRWADDCDGDPTNGTPHAAAIYAALNLHEIAAGQPDDDANQDNDTLPVASFAKSCTADTCSFDAGASVPAEAFAVYQWDFGDGEVSSERAPVHTYQTSGRFKVTLTVWDLCGRQDSLSRTVWVTSPAVEMGETGTVILHNLPVTVSLQRSYTNPVVFATLSHSDWTVPAVARVYNVTADSFQIRIDRELNPADPTASAEAAHYLVLEAGAWTLQGSGARLEVGTVDTAAEVGRFLSDAWQGVGFTSTFGGVPVILSQVQSQNNGDWISTRQRNGGVGGFELAMEPFENSQLNHGTETVGWLAMEPGTGLWSEHEYEASRARTVSSQGTSFVFSTTCGSGWYQPRFLASLGSFNERHGHLRWPSVVGEYSTDPVQHPRCTVETRAEEDVSYDSETDHVAEELDSLIIDDGLLRAVPATPAP